MPTSTQTTGVASLDTALLATGFRWSLVPDFKVADITSKLQHRRDEGENKAAVKRYYNKLKAGSVPPPICVTRDGVIVFGNHRKASAILAGWETLPAIVIDVDGNGADEHTSDQLRSIAFAENSPHGVPYSAADRAEAAKHLLALGFTNRSIQAELGLSGSQVTGLKREVDTAKHFEALGLSDKDFKVSTVRAFAGPDAAALNNEPFKQLVTLTRDANLTTTEINAFAKQTKDAGSDADALVLLNTVRAGQDMQERIAQVAAGGQVRPTPLKKLKGLLTQIDTLCGGNHKVFMDHGDVDQVQDTIDLLDRVVGCLSGIRDVQ